ncbi:MAG TPA: ABC transporter permease [Candidatus Eisenbacteria bacterium]|nr:ABC transporter permease [Candidatus Eisenbacteria bacterium]
MNAIWAIAWKDLRLLLRDKADLFWVLAFPILIAFFFGSISGGGGKRAVMPIAIADLDRTDYSRAIVKRLASSEALRVREAPLDSARLLVRRGDLVAYVALLPGTSESFGFGGDSASGIEIGVDPRRGAEREYLRGLVTAALFQSMRGSFGAGGSGRELVRRNLDQLRERADIDPALRDRRTRLLTSLEAFMSNLDSSDAAAGTTAAAGDDSTEGSMGPNLRVVEVAESESGPRTAYEVTFPSSIAWALIGVCMSFAVSIVYERITGTFLRLRLAPISRAQVLAGKGLASFVASIVAVTFVLALGVTLFHVRVSSPLMLAAAIASSAFCFTGVMMVVAVLGRTPPSVAGAGWAIMMIMSMTGGGMVPLIAMPAWMQTISRFSLVKYAVLSVEGAVWRGFGWGEMLPVLAVPLAAGLAGIVIGTRVLQSRDN